MPPLTGTMQSHRDPSVDALALDDGVRAFQPTEVLLSCLPETRFGLTRKDLVEWAKARFEPEVEVTHIPVRIEDDAVRWDVIHTLVVATQTVDSPDLVGRLKERHSEQPHRYTIISPRSGRPDPRAGLLEARLDPGRALPRRDRRHRAADEPGSLPRGPERDRALPHRRRPDLDPAAARPRSGWRRT